MFYFHPYLLQDEPILTCAYFSNGWWKTTNEEWSILFAEMWLIHFFWCQTRPSWLPKPCGKGMACHVARSVTQFLGMVLRKRMTNNQHQWKGGEPPTIYVFCVCEICVPLKQFFFGGGEVEGRISELTDDPSHSINVSKRCTTKLNWTVVLINMDPIPC